jgi:hypothetical protein
MTNLKNFLGTNALAYFATNKSIPKIIKLTWGLYYKTFLGRVNKHYGLFCDKETNNHNY